MPTAEQAKAVEKLKMNLRENSSPFFEEDELFSLLEDANWDVGKASYEGLLRKAEDDSITLPSGLAVPNNQNYWLRLAKRYRGNAGGALLRGDAVGS